MKAKNKILYEITNLILFFLFLLTPLYLFSLISTIRSVRNEANFIEKQRRLNEDVFLKGSAIDENFLPIYYPAAVKEYFKGTNFYPVGSLPNQNSYYCNEGYGLVKFKTDRLGMRNKDDSWSDVLKKENIFVIGDSFAQGACVPDKNTISEILSKKTKLNTLNLASGGNGPVEYMSLIKNVVKPIISNTKENNKVILIFYDNDNIIFDNKSQILLRASKPIFFIDTNRNIVVKEEYKRFLKNAIEKNYPFEKTFMKEQLKKNNVNSIAAFKGSNLWRIITLHPVRSLIKVAYNKILGPSPSLSEIAIDKLSETCINKCTPYVSYIPNSEFWRPNSLSKQYKNELLTASESRGIKFIDGSLAIDSNDKKNYAKTGPHLSIVGYQKIANYINSKINY